MALWEMDKQLKYWVPLKCTTEDKQLIVMLWFGKAKMALGMRGGIWKFRYLLPELGWGNRAVNLKPCSKNQNTRNTQKKTSPADVKGETVDSTEHSSSNAGSPETQSRLFPDDPPYGHRTVWGRRQAVGAEVPREAPGWGPKSPRAVTGQDARGSGCRPRPHAARPRGLRSERRHTRLGSAYPRVDRGQTRVLPGPVPTRHSTASPHRWAAHLPFLGFPESLLWLPRPLQTTAQGTLRQSHRED